MQKITNKEEWCMKNGYQVSALQERWLDEANCLVGFTITYADGTIENHVRRCTVQGFSETLKEMRELRQSYQNKEQSVKQSEEQSRRSER
jgi:hypothetical protein